MDVRERLQFLMDERHWTIYRVAKEAGIPWSTVRNMFKRNTEPSLSTLECICKGMGITLAQFFDFDHTMGLSEPQQLLLSQWNLLNEKEKALVASLIDLLATKASASSLFEK